MLVSVVVCTCSVDDYQNLVEAVDSLLEQTHREMEIVVVVDGSDELYERTVTHYSSKSNVKIALTKQTSGAFGAANVGVQMARGEIIAFMDDDAIAERRWVENLIDTYHEFDAIAVGGKILPIWRCKKPEYLIEEMYWLVGLTHKGFAEEKAIEVRNTFGPNMSFKREVFNKIGLFNEELGFARRIHSYMQGAEAEFALRMKQQLGKGVSYNPKAIVYHKISPSKVRLKMLLKRAFYQGYSKALLRRLSPSTEALAVERSYLKSLLVKHIPDRIKGLFSRSNSATEMKSLSFLVVSIFSVGIGFLCGYVKRE